MIAGLIDKVDNFELIRDQIAAILATESISQQAIAVAAGKDPAFWKLRVFIERSNPFEQFLNDQSDISPIINIWVDNIGFDKKSSNEFERQKADAVYNIDCYGYGVSEASGGGHKAGDKEAALEVQRTIRLVRNIIMSADYLKLGLTNIVWSRWPQSITIFQPEQDGRGIQQIVGARLALRVSFNEFAPQFVANTLDEVFINFKRASDGSIILETDYDYT